MKLNVFKKFIENIKNKKELDRIDHGYSLVKSSNLINKKEKYMLDISRGYDQFGYMSESLGMELEAIFKDDNYILGIHRTGPYMSDDKIDKIFNEGLINNGDIMVGAKNGQADITKTVSLYLNFAHFIGHLKAANSYKNSDGCFIIKVPKSYVGYKEGEIKPIYKKDDTMLLLPEYIYGYIEVKDAKLNNIIRNPNYENIHNYANDNLYYDEKAYYNLRKILLMNYLDTYYKEGYNQAHQALITYLNDNSVHYFSKEQNFKKLLEFGVNNDTVGILKSRYQGKNLEEIALQFEKDIINYNYKPNFLSSNTNKKR